jgi:hypothetical protein
MRVNTIEQLGTAIGVAAAAAVVHQMFPRTPVPQKQVRRAATLREVHQRMVKHRRDFKQRQHVQNVRTAALRANGQVGLRSGVTTFGDSNITVDVDRGIISNISLMSIGPATGHGFSLDGVSLDQFVQLAQSQEPEGVKVRFSHPEIDETTDPATGKVQQVVADDTGMQIGRLHMHPLSRAFNRGWLFAHH